MRAMGMMCWLAVAFTLWVQGAAAELRIAVTTSFENSGLANVLLPAFEDAAGHPVQMLVVGTGQALRLGRAGDVDAVLVHAPAREAAFVAAGHAPYRREIMYNDFVLIGPADDPASIAAAPGAAAALGRIAATEAPFVSRGDDSGTHAAEKALWDAAGIDPEPGSGVWYRSAGAGMGAALNVAVGMGAYVLSDRASWLKFGNKGDLVLLFEGDPALFNQYAYLPMSGARNAAAARALEDFLTSPIGQGIIAEYRLNGVQLFVPNAATR